MLMPLCSRQNWAPSVILVADSMIKADIMSSIASIGFARGRSGLVTALVFAVVTVATSLDVHQALAQSLTTSGDTVTPAQNHAGASAKSDMAAEDSLQLTPSSYGTALQFDHDPRQIPPPSPDFDRRGDFKFLDEQTNDLAYCPEDLAIWSNCYGRAKTDDAGSWFEGSWTNDQPNGKGRFDYPNGDTYIGEVAEGRRHGQGEYIYADGSKHVGQYLNGEANGSGTFTWKEGPNAGDVYTGGYKDGLRHGIGYYKFANGETYSGEFKQAMSDGKGVHTWPDGRSYEGLWKAGKQHGQGTFTFADGSKYIGDWDMGCRTGTGTFIYADGRRDVGEFKSGKLHGMGIRYSANGDVKEQGRFENGTFTQGRL